MLTSKLKHRLFRPIILCIVSCWLAIAIAPLLSPAAAQTERTKAFPYPTQTLPGQNRCIVLDRHEYDDQELTPQERYARDDWGFPERWMWRQICAGQEANFYRLFVGALILSELDIEPESNQPIENIKQTIKTIVSSDGLDAFLDSVFNKNGGGSGSNLEYFLENLPIKVGDELRVGENDREAINSIRSHLRDIMIAIFKDFIDDDECFLKDKLSCLESAEKFGELAGLTGFNGFNNPDSSSFEDAAFGGLQRPEEFIYLSQLITAIHDRDIQPDEEVYSQGEVREKYKKVIQAIEREPDSDGSGDDGNSGNGSKEVISPSIPPEFLRVILLSEPFRSALPSQVKINGGYFRRGLSLEAANVRPEVTIQNSWFEDSLNASKASFENTLDLQGTSFKKGLVLNEVNIGGNLFLQDIILRCQDCGSEDGQTSKPKLNLENSRIAKVTIGGELSDSKNDSTVEDIRLDGSILERLTIRFDENTSLKEYFFVSQPEKDHAGEHKVQKIFASLGHLFSASKLDDEPSYKKAESTKDEDEDPSTSTQLGLRSAEIGTVNFEVNKVEDGGLADELPKLSELKSGTYQCGIDLSRFSYSNANDAAFLSMNRCLIAKYEQVISSQAKTANRESEIDAVEAASNLLQPFGQAASVAQSLGEYEQERGFRYRQKRLETLIEKENENWLNHGQLKLRDWVYGYGYKRSRTLGIFFVIWFLGLLLACRLIFSEQAKKIEDEQDALAATLKLFNSNHFKTQSLQFIEGHFTQASKILFYATQSEQGKFDLEIFLQTHPSLHSDFSSDSVSATRESAIRYFKSQRLTVYDNSFSWLYPFWFVANLAQLLKTNSYQLFQANSYILQQQNSIRTEREFSIHLRDVVKLIDSLDGQASHVATYGLLRELFPSPNVCGIWVNTQEGVGYLEGINLKNETSSSFVIASASQSWLAVVSAALFPSLIAYGVYSQNLSSMGSLSEVILSCIPLVLFSISAWLMTAYSSPVLSFHSRQETKGFWGRSASKWSAHALMISAIFSLDTLLPIIDIERKYQDFVFGSSEGITRIFFVLQRVMALVLASILLPIFLLGGL